MEKMESLDFARDARIIVAKRVLLKAIGKKEKDGAELNFGLISIAIVALVKAFRSWPQVWKIRWIGNKIADFYYDCTSTTCSDKARSRKAAKLIRDFRKIFLEADIWASTQQDLDEDGTRQAINESAGEAARPARKRLWGGVKKKIQEQDDRDVEEEELDEVVSE